MRNLGACPLLLALSFFVCTTTLLPSSSAADTIDVTTSLRDGEILVSAGGIFELGFVSLGASTTRRYLCVRSTKGQERPVVWVANRDRPLNDSTGVLRFGRDGNLVVLGGAGDDVLWSTELASNASGNRVARLLDTGNLVVRESRRDDLPSTRPLWQSFDEPGDTLLPGMRLLVNSKTGSSRYLTSWRSADDPSPGNCSYRLEIDELPRLVLREGSTIKFSSGSWNGIRFSGFAPMNANDVFESNVVSSGDETYYADGMIEKSSLLRVLLVPSGKIQRLVWREKTRRWSILWTAPSNCQQFALCGPYGTCGEENFPFCNCLRGFRPKLPQDWSYGRGTDGCVRTTSLSCGGGDDFLLVQKVKLPEMNNSTVDMQMSLEECREKCTRDCSCTAYARAGIKGGRRGCITWSGDLVDLRNISNDDQEFYLRVAASETDSVTSDLPKKRSKQLAIILPASIILVIFLLALGVLWMKKLTNKIETGRRTNDKKKIVEGDDVELRVFDIETMAYATNNFSISNRIGEGGFGIVYKGTLESGQEIAVKRLLRTSIEGVHEFMNEIKLIVKLQHKNLVRILGCCIEGDERILIFEYLQNKSLDSFIFDEAKRALLSWRMRLNIILGIARGLLYLHHDSRLKIIHRDLKASNILLDDAMNPKITDFGTARIFEANQHTENTKRVIGTYGYMSPEYAINGIISTKSDVFSFGVIVLEVLSGMRSRGIYETESCLNLLSLAWKLWQEGNCLELLDPTVASSSHKIELTRCIQIGLLCVQNHATDRPTMSDIVTMLSTENFSLPYPKEPGFLAFRDPYYTEVSPSQKQESSTTNGLTSTSILEGR